MALPPQYRLWRPYIGGIRSDNNGNAAINTIKNAGVTGWDNDFGDAEEDGCKRGQMMSEKNNNDEWGGKKKKKLVITDNLQTIVNGEILGERPAGANEDDWDWYEVASFDIDGGGEKGSCYNGEDLHVV